MANIETHLRELGVLVGIKNEVSDLKLTSASISDSDFCSIIDSILTSSKHSQYNNIRSVKFGLSERNIIKNAFELSKVIVNKLHIHSIISADWFGYDSGKEEPYDIEVNGLYISLKENSFILENMGLYKLLNCFTGSTYKTRHIFEDYAPKEYSSWFDTTWKCLLTYLSNHSNEWNYINPKNHNKRAKITKTSTAVILEYIEEKFNVSITLPINCTLNDFKLGTTSQIREGVFSKFIKDKLDSNPAYNSKKRTCAIAASNALENELRKDALEKENLLAEKTNEQFATMTAKINSKMEQINSINYINETHSPILTTPSTKKYNFETPDDQGTGCRFKGMITLDMAILSITPLPIITHDSLMFVQMSYPRVERTFKLYSEVDNKQIFVAVDRTTNLNDEAKRIIDSHRRLYLSPEGNELFGWYWGKPKGAL